MLGIIIGVFLVALYIKYLDYKQCFIPLQKLHNELLSNPNNFFFHKRVNNFCYIYSSNFFIMLELDKIQVSLWDSSFEKVLVLGDTPQYKQLSADIFEILRKKFNYEINDVQLSGGNIFSKSFYEKEISNNIVEELFEDETLGENKKEDILSSEEVNLLLEKISSYGINSLSLIEREALTNYSNSLK